jgi:hypothetical protein
MIDASDRFGAFVCVPTDRFELHPQTRTLGQPQRFSGYLGSNCVSNTDVKASIPNSAPVEMGFFWRMDVTTANALAVKFFFFRCDSSQSQVSV